MPISGEHAPPSHCPDCGAATVPGELLCACGTLLRRSEDARPVDEGWTFWLVAGVLLFVVCGGASVAPVLTDIALLGLFIHLVRGWRRRRRRRRSAATKAT